jgi:transposase InsO family protein
MKYAFIAAQKANYPVAMLCGVLQVSRSAFYAGIGRKPACRVMADMDLAVRIRAIHKASRGTYGSPRVHRSLRKENRRVGCKRVERLMRAEGLYGRRPRRWRRTTDSSHAEPVAKNVLERQFTPSEPNCVWAADITYVWTAEGWLYLAVVLDLFARRVVGWAMADHLRAELAINALTMALGRRCPPATLVHHSDRGIQYASDAYQRVLRAHGIQCSMSRRANCWDNAVVESFFATLKVELIHRRSWATRHQVRQAVVEYMEVFYNAHRLHSSLDYRTPNDCEKEFMLTAAQAA